MNYIKHLTGFFEKVERDKFLNPTHISLYIALFQGWNCNRFRNPISISRDELMRISKISSKATYHKCLKALHTQGYIKYEPSYNPYRGSHVYLFNFADDLKPFTKNERKTTPIFEPTDEQVLNKPQSANETSTELVVEQVLVPYINNTNITNNQNSKKGLNANEPFQKIEASNQVLKIDTNEKEEKSSAKKEESPKEMPDTLFHQNKGSQSPAFADYTAEQTETSRQKSSSKIEENEIEIKVVTSSAVEKPFIEDVLSYFSENNFPELEATKFFNFNNSIGWLVGGRTPMVDWHSAAKNWMLNAPKYQSQERHDRTTNLNTSTNKDYSEPL